MKAPMPIKRVAESMGGIPALADALRIHRTAPHFWKMGVPVKRARAVSELTGIPLHELRPDVWEAPELPAKSADTKNPASTSDAAGSEVPV
jgi:hypothetical protein